MRTGGCELDKKTAGKQTDQSNCVVNSLSEVLGTGTKLGKREKIIATETDRRDRKVRFKMPHVIAWVANAQLVFSAKNLC